MKRLFAKIDSSNICQTSLFANINPRKTCKHIPDVFFWEIILCESILNRELINFEYFLKQNYGKIAQIVDINFI